MFCRELVAQLRDVLPTIRAHGAELVVVGNGSPDQARFFREDLAIDTPLFTDPTLASYRAAGMKRGVFRTLNPLSAISAARALWNGHMQKRRAGDDYQQGGVLVLARGGEVVYAFASDIAGEHPPIAEIVASLDKLRPSAVA